MINKRLYKILKRALTPVGVELYVRHRSWPDHPDFSAARRAVDKDAIKGIPEDRCFVLFRMAQSIAKVPGHIAECGSRYGKSARYILDGLGPGSDKRLHVFDSFEGLSAPGAGDVEKSSGGEVGWNTSDLAVDVEVFRKNIAIHGDRVVIHKGWIPERFSEVKSKTFCLVHIDVDLYQPTRDSLAFFYDRVAPGGIIICDDYGSPSCPGARAAFDEFFAGRPEVLIELPNMQALVVKGAGQD